MAIERTAGFFARDVLKRFSHLPIVDELRLNNARIRDHFLTSIFTLAGFREIEVTRDREALARFHAPNKFLLKEDVRASIQLAKESGLYTTLNYLVFPGVTDREEELEALLALVRETRADMIQMRNLSIDPELYLRTVPPAHGKCVGIRTVLRTIRREFPQVELGYFNRPKELFGTRLCETLIF